jgi:COMPASS component SWD3
MDDDANQASDTTEDDPQIPEKSGQQVPSPPAPAARERPRYELKHTLTGHTSSISAVKFSPDGTLLASSGALIRFPLWRRQF